MTEQAPDPTASTPGKHAGETPEQRAARKHAKAVTRRRRRFTLAAITLAVFTSWLGSSVFLASHQALSIEFGASAQETTVAIASYSLALIAVAVAGGRFADLLGRRRVFLHASLVFVAAAVVQSLSPRWSDTIWIVLVTRTIMGACAGVILASTGGILITTLKGDVRHNAWLLWRGASLGGLVIGPVVGPVLTASAWQVVAALCAALMAAAVVLAALGMDESRDEKSLVTAGLLVPAGFLGLVLLSPYVALLLLRSGGSSGEVLLVVALIGVVSVLGFVLSNRRFVFVDDGVLTHNTRLWLTDAFSAMHVAGLFIVLAATGVVLEQGSGLSPVATGIALLAMSLPALGVHLLAHRIRERHALTRQRETLLGATLLVVAIAWWWLVARSSMSLWAMLPWMVVVGWGFGLMRLLGHLGIIKTTGKRWAATVFGTRTFGNHFGVAVGAVVVAVLLASQLTPARGVAASSLGQAAGDVAAWTMTAVVVLAGVFAALKYRLLGFEDPHWHPPAAEPASAAAS